MVFGLVKQYEEKQGKGKVGIYKYVFQFSLVLTSEKRVFDSTFSWNVLKMPFDMEILRPSREDETY